MNNNTILNDEIIRIVQNDAEGIAPNDGVRQRLEYAFLLKSSTAEVKQNSFAGMFSWLFSWSHLPLKAGLVSIILLVSLLNMPSIENQFLAPLQDTTMNVLPFQIDSSETSPFFADTCFTGHTCTQEQKNNPTDSEFLSFLNTKSWSASITSRLTIGSKKQTALANLSPFHQHRIWKKLPRADLTKLARYESRWQC